MTTGTATICVQLENLTKSLEDCETSLDKVGNLVTSLSTSLDNMTSYISEKVREINEARDKIVTLEVEQGKFAERLKFLEVRKKKG